MPSFTSRRLRSQDKLCTVSNSSHMYTQPEMSIIWQVQHANEHCPVKTSSVLSHHSLDDLPNQTLLPLFSAIKALLLPPPKRDIEEKLVLQMQVEDTLTAAHWTESYWKAAWPHVREQSIWTALAITARSVPASKTEQAARLPQILYQRHPASDLMDHSRTECNKCGSE